MIDIHGVQPPVAPRAIEQTSAITPGSAKVEPAGVSDVVEISDVARLAAKVNEIPDVRADLVQQVKAELAAGTYETPEKIEIAVERLMEEFFM